MKEFRLRGDLERAEIDGFALPLGFEPGNLPAPRQGFTVAYNTGENDDPDTYTFQVVVSHERLAHVCRACFRLLPEQVFAIVEIGSRDAYRSVDVYLGAEAVSLDDFEDAWNYFEPFLLEDGSVAAGANAEEPFVEVFVDQRKAVIIHVPLDMHEDVVEVLHKLDLQEVPETWPEEMPADDGDGPRVRQVLDVSDAFFPDVDELLLQLRHNWRMQLNVDRTVNLDEAGRELGLTLWHVVVIAQKVADPDTAAYVSVWVTGKSLDETEALVEEGMESYPDWQIAEIYTVDRVAYDERPDELLDLPPKPEAPMVHLVSFEPATEPGPAGQADG